MKIQIDEMVASSDDKYPYLFRYGGKTLEGAAQVTIQDHDGLKIKSITLRPRSVSDFLAFAGAHSAFAKDFWAFLDGKARPFPWTYNDTPEDMVDKIIAYHHL